MKLQKSGRIDRLSYRGCYWVGGREYSRLQLAEEYRPKRGCEDGVEEEPLGDFDTRLIGKWHMPLGSRSYRSFRVNKFLFELHMSWSDIG
jgi:hypothetical protein